MNSEGSSFVRDDPAASVTVRAGTRADDGTEISDSFTAFGRIWGDLPALAELVKQGQVLAGRLEDLRQAQVFERYAGPVLFEGQAAAELVRQVLVPRLLVQKAPVADDQRMCQTMDRLANPFQDKLGSRVLPRFLAIVDDPALRENEQGPLWGGYAVDDEGVPARETVLERAGVAGIPRSNGKGASNLLTVSLVVRSPTSLFGTHVEQWAPTRCPKIHRLAYGIVVRRLQEPSAGQFGAGRSRGGRLIRAVVAVKVFPDGSRGTELTGLSERLIVAASEALTNHTILFRRKTRSVDKAGCAPRRDRYDEIGEPCRFPKSRHAWRPLSGSSARKC